MQLFYGELHTGAKIPPFRVRVLKQMNVSSHDIIYMYETGTYNVSVVALFPCTLTINIDKINIDSSNLKVPIVHYTRLLCFELSTRMYQESVPKICARCQEE